MKKTYVAVKTVHLSDIKRTVPRGTEIVYSNNNGVESYEIAGLTISDMDDFNICVSKGLFVLADEFVDDRPVVSRPAPKREEPAPEKMPVVQSDEDLMTTVIDISDTKVEHVEEAKRIREEASRVDDLNDTGRESRGMKILHDSRQDIVREIPAIEAAIGVEVTEPTEISDISDSINVGSRIVAKIGKNAEEGEALLAAAAKAAKNTVETSATADSGEGGDVDSGKGGESAPKATKAPPKATSKADPKATTAATKAPAKAPSKRVAKPRATKAKTATKSKK